MEATSLASWSGLQDLEPVLRGYLGRRCRDDSEVDDVIQETLLRAARYRGSLADPARLRGWALRIASNVLRDYVRRECRLKRAEMTEEGLDNLEGREPAPEEGGDDLEFVLGQLVVERPAALHHLERALEELRQDDRRVLQSFYGGRQCCSVTAVECDIPRGLVKVRLFRARKRLGRVLRRRFLLEERRRLEKRGRMSSATPTREAC